MGFNAVHLLPVTTLGASQSPYAAGDLFALDPSYLTGRSGSGGLSQTEEGLSQMEEFVEEAKALGLRLCFDLVVNHVGVDSAMVRRAPDWIVPDQNRPDGFQRAGYWSGQTWRTWDDLVLIHYEHPSEAIRAEIWAYVTEYALFWAKYADDTGGLVRLDNLHGSDPRFVQALTSVLHSEYPEVGLLAEFFTDDRALLDMGLGWGLNLLLATPWEHKFVPDLREYLKYVHRVSGHVRYFMPITSHDSGAPAQEFGTSASTVPRYVAAALLGTGATGMPQGVEFGEQERINFIGRKPKTAYPKDPEFAPIIGRVNAILAGHPAFRRGENCRFVDAGHPAVIAAFRQDTNLSQDTEVRAAGFLVVCNFDTLHPQRITVDLAPLLQADGPFECFELLSGEARSIPNPQFEFLLPPCVAQVLMFPGS